MVPMGSTTTPCKDGAAARQHRVGSPLGATGLSPLQDFLSTPPEGFSFFFFPSDLPSLTLHKGKISWQELQQMMRERRCCVSPSRTEVKCHKMHTRTAAGPAMTQPTVRHFVSSPRVWALWSHVFLRDINDSCFCWCPMDFFFRLTLLHDLIWGQGTRDDFFLLFRSALYKTLLLVLI